jgi:hypothetical protein
MTKQQFFILICTNVENYNNLILQKLFIQKKIVYIKLIFKFDVYFSWLKMLIYWIKQLQ